MKKLITLSMAALVSVGLSSNLVAEDVTDTVMYPVQDIQYKPLGADPNGPQGVVLFGDPSKEGPYIMRVKYPADMVVPPHTHGDKVKVVSLLEGVIYLGYSETVDMSKTTKLTPGSIWTEPKGVAHFGKMGPDGATLEVQGVGPSSMVPIK